MDKGIGRVWWQRRLSVGFAVALPWVAAFPICAAATEPTVPAASSSAQFVDRQGRTTRLDLDPAVLDAVRRELAASPATGKVPRAQTLRLDCESIARTRDSLRHAPAPRLQPAQPSPLAREPSAPGAAGDAAHQRAKSAATLDELGRRFGCARNQ